MGRDICQLLNWVAQSPSNLALMNALGDGTATASLCNLLWCLTTLSKKCPPSVQSKPTSFQFKTAAPCPLTTGLVKSPLSTFRLLWDLPRIFSFSAEQLQPVFIGEEVNLQLRGSLTSQSPSMQCSGLAHQVKSSVCCECSTRLCARAPCSSQRGDCAGFGETRPWVHTPEAHDVHRVQKLKPA